MPRTKFPVEILTPEGEVFKEEIEMISTRTTVGLIGILAHHEPLLATLEPTELRLYRSDTDIVRFAQGEGYLQVTKDRTLLLVQDAVPPESLDATELRERLQEAESEEHTAGDASEPGRQAAREAKRLRAFLRIAEGG